MATRLPPDIILLICEELGNQRAFGTLFNVAVSSKNLAGSALLWMYRIHTQTAIRGDESNEDEMTKAEQLKTVLKWALQWRSIIISSFGETAYPYCLYIRSLDLSNFEQLLTDTLSKRVLYQKLFTREMREFFKLSERPPLRGQQVLQSEIIDMVGTTICSHVGDFADRHGGTAALEELSGEIRKDSLPKWIGRIPRLKSLTLWNGQILDKIVADAVKTNCADFDALTIYRCKGDNVDSDLSSFFSGLRNNTLRHLQVTSHHDLGVETFLSLNNHHRSLKVLVLNNLTAPIIKALPSLKGCTSIQRLTLENVERWTDLAGTDKDILLEIIAWLTSCKQLRSIQMENFINGPRILTAVCLEDGICLKKLLLTKYSLPNNQEFHRALAQQTSLESVHLNADVEDSFRDDIDILVSSLCQLKNLRNLNILDTSDLFKTSEVQLLAMNLSKLEEFSVGGIDITDEVWHAVSTLPNLRSLSFHAFTTFTYRGILDYITTLQPTNAGLQLSIMCAAIGSDLTPRQVTDIRAALGHKVRGKFDFELYRDRDAEWGSDSESD